MVRQLEKRERQRTSITGAAAPVAHPSGGPSAPPPDCAAAWAKYAGEAAAVLARGRDLRTGRVDPFERNRAIAAGYARNPEQRVPYAQAVVRSFSDQIAAGGAARAAAESALRQLADLHPYRVRP